MRCSKSALFLATTVPSPTQHHLAASLLTWGSEPQWFLDWMQSFSLTNSTRITHSTRSRRKNKQHPWNPIYIIPSQNLERLKKKTNNTCMQLNILKILFHCYLYLPILITDKKSSQNMDKGKQETISNVLFSKSHRTLFIPKVHPTCPLIHLNLHHCWNQSQDAAWVTKPFKSR